MTPPARVIAVDLARLVAILGMILAHLVAPATEPPASLITAAVTGFPSTLFAVVAGVGAALAADRLARDPLRSAPWAAEAAQLARAVVVVLAGLVLALVPTDIAIVLVPLGASLAIAAPLVRAPSAVVAGLAAVLAVAGPLAIAAGIGRGSWPLDGLLLGGTYPVVTWLVYVLLGVLAGRAVAAAERSGRTRGLGVRLAIGGATAALAATAVDAAYAAAAAVPEWMRERSYGAPHGTGWDAILLAAPHTGTTGDIVRTAGGAILVIGALLALVPDDAAAGGIVRALAAAGGAGLTIYVAHVLSTSVLLLPDLPDPQAVAGAVLAADLALVAVLGAVLARIRRRGPLEAVVRAAGLLGAGIARRAGRSAR